MLKTKEQFREVFLTNLYKTANKDNEFVLIRCLGGQEQLVDAFYTIKDDLKPFVRVIHNGMFNVNPQKWPDNPRMAATALISDYGKKRIENRKCSAISIRVDSGVCVINFLPWDYIASHPLNLMKGNCHLNCDYYDLGGEIVDND